MKLYVRIAKTAGIVTAKDMPMIGSFDGWDEDGNACFDATPDELVLLLQRFPQERMLVELL